MQERWQIMGLLLSWSEFLKNFSSLSRLKDSERSTPTRCGAAETCLPLTSRRIQQKVRCRAAKLVQSKRGYKLLFPIPNMQSAFHRAAQRAAFRRRDGASAIQ